MLSIDRSKLEEVCSAVNSGKLAIGTLNWLVEQYNLVANQPVDIVHCQGLVSLIESDTDVLMVETASK